MFKITDPKDCVYYIQLKSENSDGSIDPNMPFSNEDEAVEYALKTMGLSVFDFNIVKWEVD